MHSFEMVGFTFWVRWNASC